MRARAARGAILAVALGLLTSAAPAGASFHDVKIREVFPGTAANPDSDYVVLQAYAAGQNLVNGGQLRVYNADATAFTNLTPGTSVANGSNQMTVLIADSQYSSQFPSGPAPNFTFSNLDLSPLAGAVCWPMTSAPIDCASWGNFTGTASLPAPNNVGSPASPAGITDLMAIERRIDFGCETLLQPLDDNNQNSTDFSEQTPGPRNNASAIVEENCVLNVSRTGSGTVTSVGQPGIGCPPDCTHTYFNGEVFDLQATPVAGGAFNSWTNCPGTPVDDVCQGVNMSHPRTASADFAVVDPPPPPPSDPGTPVTPVTTPAAPTAAAPAPAKKKCKKKGRSAAIAAKKCKKK